VYGIAKQTGGAVRIDSTLGKGTTVAVYLPRARSLPAHHKAEEEALTATPVGHATILVADDDRDVRELLISCLESLGYRVLAASNPINMRDASEIERAAAAAVIRAQPRPPRDAVHKMATELENYGPPRFQGGVRAIRATLSRKGSTV
jgi:predicted dinucleotide-binding enzyme